MADEKDPPPLLGYLTGKLTPAEQEELARRALQDQDVFDALFDLSESREVLQEPTFRQRLRSRLQDLDRPRWRALAWLVAPTGRFVLAGAALAALLMWAPWKTNVTEEPLTLLTNAGADVAVFFQLPKGNPMGLRLELDRSTYRPGDVIRATVHLPRPAALFVLRRQANGNARLIFPLNPADPATQPAGGLRLSFDPVPPTEDVQARQVVTLRAIALAPGIDLRSQALDWAKLGAAYSVLEKQYDVVP